MKLKIKKCPQCGFEARILDDNSISESASKEDLTLAIMKAVMGKSSNASNPDREKIFGADESARISGCKKMTWLDPRDIADYEAMRNCPHCEIPLVDMPEEK